MPERPAETYFFDDGIAFHCRQCGHCCTGEPGIVRVNDQEAAVIARALGLDPETFHRECLNAVDGGLSIRERGDGQCLFYDNGCRIYPHRPAQCRTYPFWLRNLRSVDCWRQTLSECPGIGTGPVSTREQILSLIHAQIAARSGASQDIGGPVPDRDDGDMDGGGVHIRERTLWQ